MHLPYKNNPLLIIFILNEKTMKKISLTIFTVLSFATLSINAQTQCDPYTPAQKPGRCSYFNSPDGDVAICNNVPVVGTYCGYGVAEQQE